MNTCLISSEGVFLEGKKKDLVIVIEETSKCTCMYKCWSIPFCEAMDQVTYVGGYKESEKEATDQLFNLLCMTPQWKVEGMFLSKSYNIYNSWPIFLFGFCFLQNYAIDLFSHIINIIIIIINRGI